MKHYDLLIIGGNGAGMSAASQARRVNKDMSIGVFEKSGFVSYAACGMPYFIDNYVKDFEKLIAIDVDQFIKKRNIQISMNSAVEKIDFKKKEVNVNKGGQTEVYSYNKLVIATGAKAVDPGINGSNSKNIFTLRKLEDSIAIKTYINSEKPKKGIIIGGGFIGLEMAESLRTLDIETIMLEKMNKIAAAFDDEIRALVLKEMEKNSVTVRTGVNIKEITQEKSGLSVITDSDKYQADFILISAGIRPNTDFLKDTNLKLTKFGAIIVNEKSETNIPDVYAAGDCATAKHLILNKDVYMPLGTTSNKQGRVAGLQTAGIDTERFKGVLGSQQVKVFELELGKTGLSESDAEREGIKSESSAMPWKSRAGYYPGTEDILVKITINSDTREIIGGQVAGHDGAALRINVIAAAVTCKMKIEDFAYLDLAYAPPFSPVWDSVLGAAQNLVKR